MADPVELYPSDTDLDALSGEQDAEQEVLFVTTGEAPYYTSFYKMLQRLLKATRRAGDLRVFKDGDLTFGVRPGKYPDGDTAVDFSQVTAQALTDDQTNYIYLTAVGVLTVNTSGFPTPSAIPHIPLATILTASGEYDGRDVSEGGDITDYRGRGLMGVCGGESFKYIGNSYIIVNRGVTDTISGTNLLAAYTAAKALTPGGNALAADNRVCVLLPPGIYLITSMFSLDTDFVDIAGMVPGQPACVKITRSQTDADNNPTVYQTADDVRMSSFTIENTGTSFGIGLVGSTGLFINATDNDPSIYRFMKFVRPGGAAPGTNNKVSVYGYSDIGGLWEFCDADDHAWRMFTNKTLKATMRYCVGEYSAFGGDCAGVSISGKLYHCKAGDRSFGGCNHYGCDITGELYDCEAGEKSYAIGKEFSGKAYRCVGGDQCFAGYSGSSNYGTFSGYAEDCVAGSDSFGMGHASCILSGTLLRCRAGSEAEYKAGTSGAGVTTFSGVCIGCHPWVPKALTVDTTIREFDSGQTYTNEGAAAKRNHPLPGAKAGLVYTAIIEDVIGMKFTAASGDTIRLGGTVSKSGGYIESTVVGSVITFKAINATKWIVIANTGTWDLEIS